MSAAGVRWDSDHVVVLSDELLAIAQELVRGNFLGRVHIGLDFFDASINRVAAWVIGTRSMIKALLVALLEPTDEAAPARERRRHNRAARLPRRAEIAPLGGGVGSLLPHPRSSSRRRVAGGGQGVRARCPLETRLSGRSSGGKRSCPRCSS